MPRKFTRREFVQTSATAIGAAMIITPGARAEAKSEMNLRGAFGIVDSGREDVAYEDFHGHKLDRKLLELLLAN